MPDHELAMLTYARLARLSHERRQPAGCDRLLILAGAAACRAGWLDVAARCRGLVLDNNPRHLLGHYATFPDALRDADFETLLAAQERLCPYERAEHLLQTTANSDDDNNAADSTPGETALSTLNFQRHQET